MIYQLYFLDPDNRVERRVALNCDDDDSARAASAEHATGQPMELWSGARRLERCVAEGSCGQAGDGVPWPRLHVLAASGHLEEDHRDAAIVLDDTFGPLSGSLFFMGDDGRLVLLTGRGEVVEPVAMETDRPTG
jgi:hypothetical protein